MIKRPYLLRLIPECVRPYGFIFIEVGYCRNEFYTCELQLRSGEDSLMLTCQVLDLKRRSKTYSLLVFEDEARSSQLVFAHVDYFDGLGNSVNFMTTLIDQRIACLAHMVIESVHAVIYHSIVVNDKVPRHDGERASGSCHIEFPKSFMRSMHECTGTPVPQLINTVSSLLQK